MALVEPGSGRARTEHLGGEVRIIIPAKKQVSVLVLMPLVWIIAAVVGLQGVFRRMHLGSPPDLIFAGTFSCFVAFGVLTWHWALAGKEIISLTQRQLTVGKSLFGLRLKRTYDQNSASNWRVIPDAPTHSISTGQPYFSGLTGRTIAFDHGSKTVKFGIFLEAAEARRIVEELRTHGYIRGEATQR